MRARRAAAALAGTVALYGGACSAGGGEGSAGGDAVVLAVDARGVVAYSLRDSGAEQVVVDVLDGPGGDAAGGNVPGAARGVCLLPDGSRRFLVAERGRPEEGTPGWALFQLAGGRVGDLSAEPQGRLVPTYPGGADAAVPTGCAFLRDGRLVTTDFGGGPDTPGQLIVWFPPFDVAPVRYCKVDIGVAGAQAVLVGRGDAVFVASTAPPTAGVLRYDGPYPSGPDAEGDCAGRDATGAPRADPGRRDTFLPPDDRVPTADALAPAPDGGLFVASAVAGRVVQYDRLGRVVRTVLEPPPGAPAGQPPPTGTPVALAVGPAGELVYADGALVSAGGGAPTAAPGRGSVRRIRFRSEVPQPPEPLAAGLDGAVGVAVLVIPG